MYKLRNDLSFYELLNQKEQKPYFGPRIQVLKQDADREWLRSLGKNDFRHSESVENYLKLLVHDEIKETFSAGEIFVLLYAVYLHDIGYQTGKDRHEKNSYEDIINDYKKYKLNDRFEAKAVALVCYGHALEEEYPLRNIKAEYGVTGFGDRALRLRFLAALLRLADEIDNAYTRVSGYPGQKESMCHLVRFVGIDLDHWSICFQTEPTNDR